jgi:hypothetical protein
MNDINMIVTRERGNVHLQFRETCNDVPAVVLIVVEKMFAALSNLPEGIWLVRARPEITHHVDFSTDEKLVTVQCRASASIQDVQQAEVHFGLGRRGR